MSFRSSFGHLPTYSLAHLPVWARNNTTDWKMSAKHHTSPCAFGEELPALPEIPSRTAKATAGKRNLAFLGVEGASDMRR